MTVEWFQNLRGITPIPAARSNELPWHFGVAALNQMCTILILVPCVGRVKMPLDIRLMTMVLSHPCPHCGQKLMKKGSWFASRATYSCSDCHRLVLMTYGAKVTLFAKHDHLVLPI
jgi:predicted RNA-binding Zn-ribbon protein involved in translation (DUF1610 family)